MIAEEIAVVQALPTPRLVQVLGHLGIAASSWYRQSLDETFWPVTSRSVTALRRAFTH